MRRPFLLILAVLTLLLLAAGVVLSLRQQAAPLAEATPSPADLAAVQRITIEELLGQLESATPPLVWDVRPSASFAEGHIPGSRVLTLDAIPDAAAHVDKRQAIVTVCA